MGRGRSGECLKPIINKQGLGLMKAMNSSPSCFCKGIRLRGRFLKPDPWLKTTGPKSPMEINARTGHTRIGCWLTPRTPERSLYQKALWIRPGFVKIPDAVSFSPVCILSRQPAQFLPLFTRSQSETFSSSSGKWATKHPTTEHLLYLVIHECIPTDALWAETIDIFRIGFLP